MAIPAPLLKWSRRVARVTARGFLEILFKDLERLEFLHYFLYFCPFSVLKHVVAGDTWAPSGNPTFPRYIIPACGFTESKNCSCHIVQYRTSTPRS